MDAPAELWHVYFLSLVDLTSPVRDLELVKVGITKNDVERRIEQLQTGNPYQIRREASFRTSVARQVERWVHRTNVSRVAQLEWLRLSRLEIADLVKAAEREAERLAQIAQAKARWSQSRSNSKERPACAEERHLHEAIRDILSQLCPVKLRLRQTEAGIAVNAGHIARIPGIARIWVVPFSRRFSSQMAREKFPSLAMSHTVETVGGRFRWRKVPDLGAPEWTKLRLEVESLECRQRELDRAILNHPSGVCEEGARTDELAQLHEDWLLLKQQETRLEVDKEDLQAQIIQLIEDYAAITDVCSFARSPREVLNSKSFCATHPKEAAECSSERVAHVRRKIYASRSYGINARPPAQPAVSPDAGLAPCGRSAAAGERQR
jgi:hypothetical protein